MPSKACRPCYDKIMKFPKILQRNISQWYGLSAVWVKATVLYSYLQLTQDRERSWPNQKIPGCFFRVLVPYLKSESIFIFFYRKADLTASSISVSEPVKEAVISRKRRELPRGLFPQSPPKPMYSSYQGGVSPEGGLEVGRPGLRAKIISYQKIYGAVWKSSQTWVYSAKNTLFLTDFSPLHASLKTFGFCVSSIKSWLAKLSAKRLWYRNLFNAEMQWHPPGSCPATARKTRRYQSVHVSVVVLRELERSELDKQRNRCKAIFWVRHDWVSQCCYSGYH